MGVAVERLGMILLLLRNWVALVVKGLKWWRREGVGEGDGGGGWRDRGQAGGGEVVVVR